MYDIARQPAWTAAFERVFALCDMQKGERIVLLSESGSRRVNVTLAHEALTRMGLAHEAVTVPSPAPAPGPIVRSTGASVALDDAAAAVSKLRASDVVIDLTVEGLMHARDTGRILASGARILTVSNEHPDILCRLVPDPTTKPRVRAAMAACRAAREMQVVSPDGTDLTVAMEEATTVGVWGYTDRPGTLAHWPGGLVVSFPRAGAVNGRLVFAPGDVNLTFKRYFESAVTVTVQDDYVTAIDGEGADARLMRRYFEDFGERDAYATSHVGWGLNPAARYEALTMYDKADLNGTELRALAGNFLYSTGANEFAGRFARGHFDLPMMGCDILLDGVPVVEGGVPV